MTKKIKINLNVNGKRYPFIIDRKDEEIFRKASKTVDNRYKEFTSNQKTKKMTPEDCFVMIAINSYVSNFKSDNNNNENNEIITTQKLQEIAELFDNIED